MTPLHALVQAALLALLALAAYIDRVYSEMGKFPGARVPGQH